MATMIEKIYDWGPEQPDVLAVYDINGNSYEVDASDSDALTVSYVACMQIDSEPNELISFVANCFDDRSNFFDKIEDYTSRKFERKIILKYKNRSYFVTEENADYENLFNKVWNRTTSEMKHFIIGIKWNKRTRYDRLYMVKAETPEEATEIVQKREGNIRNLGSYECLGTVDRKNNTMQLNNASYFLGELRMFFLE